MLLQNLISKKTNIWLSNISKDKNNIVVSILEYIKKTKKLRQPQFEAIQNYLWLKFVWNNDKLSNIIEKWILDDEDIFSEYEIWNSNLNSTRKFLYCFAKENNLKDLEYEVLKQNIWIDWKQNLDNLLHNYEYSNYLFSLPMWAWKTYLMACFIYLDLYLANLFKWDKRFSHNFIVFAPSGSKTAILPSLQTITNFNPEWILPIDEAQKIRWLITFEILDSLSSDRKDKLHWNNPNLEKVNRLLQSKNFWLVFITNAEKVNLETYSKEDKRLLENYERWQITLFEEVKKVEDIKKQNELREKLSEIPHLWVILDEVHHSYWINNEKQEKKLRQAVLTLNQHWNISQVIWLSWTPYIDYKVNLWWKDYKITQIQDIVYNYKLSDWIANFLKIPDIYNEKDVKDENFIKNALIKFFTDYDKIYSNNTNSKLVFYCPSKKVLNEEILPVITDWYNESNRDIQEIFKFYTNSTKKDDEEKKYNIDEKKSKSTFGNLDKPHNNHIRVILLVAIGTEWWDCKSLTWVVLPRKETTTNFVLQTTCRCLREVENANEERAMIYLVKENYDILETQLKKNYKLTISDLKWSSIKTVDIKKLKTISSAKLKYKQVQKETKLITSKEEKQSLSKFDFEKFKKENDYSSIIEKSIITDKWLKTKNKEYLEINIKKDFISFFDFNYQIVDKIFWLKTFEYFLENKEIEKVYKILEKDKDWILRNPDSKILDKIISQIVSYFWSKNIYETSIITKEIEIDLLEWNIENPKIPVLSSNEAKNLFIPQVYEKATKYKLDEEDLEEIPNYDKSFNYAPYKTDSKLEVNFLNFILSNNDLINWLEIYYNWYKNNDLQSFYIETDFWKYTPDFLILKKDKDDKIEKILIVETKWWTYYNSEFKQKEKFVKEVFLKQNSKIKYEIILDEEWKNDIDQFSRQIRNMIEDFKK